MTLRLFATVVPDQNKTSVLLEWISRSSKNNYGYYFVQKSADGKMYSTIGKVKKVCKKIVDEICYLHEDKTPSKNNYYRVIDFRKPVKSEIIKVVIAKQVVENRLLDISTV